LFFGVSVGSLGFPLTSSLGSLLVLGGFYWFLGVSIGSWGLNWLLVLLGGLYWFLSGLCWFLGGLGGSWVVSLVLEWSLLVLGWSRWFLGGLGSSWVVLVVLGWS